MSRPPSDRTDQLAALQQTLPVQQLPHTTKASEQEVGQDLGGAAAVATLAAQPCEDPLTTMDKKKNVREKRILPPRMRGVSSLLAGSGLEEQLISAAEPIRELPSLR